MANAKQWWHEGRSTGDMACTGFCTSSCVIVVKKCENRVVGCGACTHTVLFPYPHIGSQNLGRQHNARII